MPAKRKHTEFDIRSTVEHQAKSADGEVTELHVTFTWPDGEESPCYVYKLNPRGKILKIERQFKTNPALVSWHSSLRGCWVVSVELLACDERGGGAVKFRPALKCKRFVFFTDASKRTHGRTLKLIKRLNRFTWHKWEFLDDEVAFRAKSTAMKNSGSVVGVCGSDELPNYSEGSVKRHMGTINQFHVWLQKHDAQQCCFPHRRFLHLSSPAHGGKRIL